MNLPIPTEGTADKLMKARGDRIAAFRRDGLLISARGMLEDLPYTVTMLYQGRTADAPFTCEFVSEGFLSEFPLCSPTPPMLSGSGSRASPDRRPPSARGCSSASPRPPTGPAEVEFKGWMDVASGRAAFYRFPYEFRDLKGNVYFDNHKVEIYASRGVPERRGADGGGVRAAQRRRGSTSTSYPGCTGGRSDAGRVRRATAAHRAVQPREVRQLLATGLVLTPERAAELRAARILRRSIRDGTAGQAASLRTELAGVEAELTRPVFEFGASADVAIDVHRPFGERIEWVTNIDVRLARAGLLPDAFPVPVMARDVVCQIRDDDARLVGGTYAGLNGGTGTVAASFILPRSSNPDGDPRPDVTIDLKDVPFDELVIRRCPGPTVGRAQRYSGTCGSPAWARDACTWPPWMCSGRHGGRRGSGTATVPASTPRPDRRPRRRRAVGTAGQGSGHAHRNHRHRRRHGAVAAARCGGPGGGAAAAVRPSPSKRARHSSSGRTATLPRTTTPEAAGCRDAHRRDGARPAVPVEPAIAVFSPKAADEVTTLRRKHIRRAPRTWIPGSRSAKASHGACSSGFPRRDVEFDWLGGRVAAAESTGFAEVQCIGGVLARLTGSAPMHFDAAPVGQVVLDGWYRFVAPRPGDAPRPRRPRPPGDGRAGPV